jgi:hypothetical protein
MGPVGNADSKMAGASDSALSGAAPSTGRVAYGDENVFT